MSTIAAMDITLPRAALHAALDLLSNAVAPSKSGIPILTTYRFDASGGRLVIEATDGIVNMRHTLTASESLALDIKESGTVCIPSDVLARVGAMSEGPINVRSRDGRITVASVGLSRRFDMFGLDAQDWPVLTVITDDAVPLFTASAAELLFMLRSVELAIGTDETKVPQNSANVIFGGGRLEFNATDGHRCHRVVRENKVTTPGRLLITQRTFTAMRYLLDDAVKAGETDISVLPVGHSFGLRIGNTEFIAKQAHADPIDISFVLNAQKWGSIITADRVALLECLKAMTISATESSGVKLSYDKAEPTTLNIKSSDPETGSGGDCIDCVSKIKWGKETTRTHCFNPKYLKDVLSRMVEEKVTLSFQGELDPVVILPGEELPETASDAAHFTVVMPMRA